MGQNKQKKQSEVRKVRQLRAIAGTRQLKFNYLPIIVWTSCLFCKNSKYGQYVTQSNSRICRKCIAFKELTDPDWACGLEACEV